MSGRLKLLKEKVQVLRNKMVYTRKCETLPTDGKEYFLKWRDWQRWAAHRNRVRILCIWVLVSKIKRCT